MTETLPASRRTGKRPITSFPMSLALRPGTLLVGRNRPAGGIHARGGERQRVHAGCTWRQRRGTGREGILAAAQALRQAAMVPDHRGHCRGRPAGRRRDGAAHPVPRPAGPPAGPQLRLGDLCCQPAARGPRHGRAEDGRPQHGSRAAAPASRAIAGAGTGRPRTGPPRRAQTGTVRGGTVARAAPSRHMDPPPPSPSPPPPKSRWMMTARGTAARPGGSARPGEPRQHAHLVAPGGLGLAERLVGGTDQFGQCPPGPVQHRDADGDRQPEHEPGV